MINEILLSLFADFLYDLIKKGEELLTFLFYILIEYLSRNTYALLQALVLPVTGR